MSSWKMVIRATRALHQDDTGRAEPSAIAVLPTPGSPTSRGLLLGAAADLDASRSPPRPRGRSADRCARRAPSIEVDAIGGKRVLALFDHVLGLCVFVGSARGGRRLGAGHLGDAVRNVVHGIEPRHVLLLQEIDRGDRARRTWRPGRWRRSPVRGRRTGMDRRALDHALEAGGGLGLLDALVGEALRARYRHS